MERRNTNLWPVEGFNHYFTDLKNWLVPKEVELPLVALPVAGGWAEVQPAASSVLGLVPSHLQASFPHQHHGDHSSDLFGKELWILLRKSSVSVYKFISLSSQYILFLQIKYNAKTPQCIVSGLSGRDRELTGKAPGWKSGCAKSFHVLG